VRQYNVIVAEVAREVVDAECQQSEFKSGLGAKAQCLIRLPVRVPVEPSLPVARVAGHAHTFAYCWRCPLERHQHRLDLLRITIVRGVELIEQGLGVGVP